MKNLYISSWGLFFMGIALKFLHVPGANICMLLSCILLVVHNIVYLCKHRKKEDIPSVLLYFSYTILTIYVFGRLAFWGFAKPLFLIGFLLVIVTLVLYSTKRESFKTPQIVLVFYFVFFFILSYTPSYKVYYALYLNKVLNKEQRDTNYRSWDMYSWFLILRDLKEEALEANQKAQKNAESNGSPQSLEVLKQHEILIKTEKNELKENELEAKWFEIKLL